MLLLANTQFTCFYAIQFVNVIAQYIKPVINKKHSIIHVKICNSALSLLAPVFQTFSRYSFDSIMVLLISEKNFRALVTVTCVQFQANKTIIFILVVTFLF